MTENTQNVNALKVVDRIDLTKFKNARTRLNVNAALRPDYVKEMQYVLLIRSRAGGKKYVTRLRLVTYFLPPALERIKNTYCMGQRPFLYLNATVFNSAPEATCVSVTQV